MDLEQKNNAVGTLAKLINQLNVPTLATILLMGGGNFLATKSTSEDQRQAVFRQINDLHEMIGDFEKRQKEALSKAASALDNQNLLLKNQSLMISNQQQFLNQLKTRNP